MATATNTLPRQAKDTSSTDTAVLASSSSTTTHYDSLNVASNATYDEIKSAFHRLARLQHPDKQGSIASINRSHHNDDGNRSGSNTTGCCENTSSTSDDDTASDFRRIQKAWQVLRDTDRRSAYDNILQHRRLREESRRSGALTISVEDDDVTEAMDPDTNEIFFVYECRCGEEIYIDVRGVGSGGAGGGDTTNCRPAGDDNVTFVDCPGCCFVYRVEGIS
jgi:DnaJ-class molecular chaperone